MGHGSVNSNNSFALGSAANRPSSSAGDKLPPPPRGYTRIWINVESSAPKDKAGEINPTDAEIEKALFESFGLAANTEADLSQIKARLGTSDNPFDAVKTTGNYTIPFRASGRYRIPLDVQNSLYEQLSGKAAKVYEQIETERRSQNRTSANPNETVAGKNGYDAARQQQAKLNRLIREAQVLPTSFGIPSELTDLTHVVLALPKGASPNAENALSAYIEKRFGGGNLFGENKIAIQNAAKQSGVQIENLKVSPNSNRVVEFDLNLESVLKLQRAYLDVQEKVNNDIAIADDVRDKMALNQFLLGVIDGAVEDVKGNYNALRHPLETLQGIRDAVNILSQLTAQDIKNIAAELGNKAANATAGEAAHAAGFVVGTVVVEAILAKGLGAALSALGKTKAGAEFLARIGKLAERTGELANSGKAKVVAAFSDEAALIASRRIRQALRNPAFYSGFAGGDLIGDFTIFAGNKLKNGAISFKEFFEIAVKEYGSNIKGKADELAQAYRQAMQKAGFGDDIVELEIEKTSKLSKYQFSKESLTAREKLLDGIREAENNGKFKGLSQRDKDWLMRDARHKELAFDPDKKQFKVDEAQTILRAEKQGLIESPVKRGIFDDGTSRGADYIDANGIEWDVKKASGGANSILDALKSGENVIVDAGAIRESDLKLLKAEIEARRPKNGNQVKYVR